MTKAPRHTTNPETGVVSPHHIYTSGVICQETPDPSKTNSALPCNNQWAYPQCVEVPRLVIITASIDGSLTIHCELWQDRPGTVTARVAIYQSTIQSTVLFYRLPCAARPEIPSLLSILADRLKSIPNFGCTSSSHLRLAFPEAGQYVAPDDERNESEHDIHRWEDEGGSLGRVLDTPTLIRIAPQEIDNHCAQNTREGVLP